MGVGPEGDLAVIVGDFDADSEIANIDPREDADLYGDIFTAGHIMTQRSLPEMPTATISTSRSPKVSTLRPSASADAVGHDRLDPA